MPVTTDSSVRSASRFRRLVDEPRHAAVRVSPQPRVNGLPHDAVPHRNLGDRRSLQDFPYSLVSLFHEPQLHEHADTPSHRRPAT